MASSSSEEHRAVREVQVNLASEVFFPRRDSSKSELQGLCYGEIRIPAEPTDQAGEEVEGCFFLV